MYFSVASSAVWNTTVQRSNYDGISLWEFCDT